MLVERLLLISVDLFELCETNLILLQLISIFSVF